MNGPTGAASAAIRVLLVEDNPMDERLTRLALEVDKARHFDVTAVDTLAAGVHKAQSESFDAIILDLQLPDSDGLANVKEIALATPRTPIVVLTSCDEDAMAIHASRHGAYNYLVKGKFDTSRLGRYLRCAIARKEFEAELAHRAHYDSLTGLVNRALFYDRLSHALARAMRCHSRMGVLFVDIDNFKLVNDAHGHGAGDEVLRAIAQVLRGAVRQSDTVARMGGDEFIILAEQVGSGEEVQMIAQKIVKLADEPLVLSSGIRIEVAVSVGVSVFPDDGRDGRVLLELADSAMLYAKRRGGKRLLTSTASARW